MNYKKLLLQTIPTVGAIGLTACAPNRSRDGDGGDGGVTGLVGAWELRSYGYGSEGSYYEFPRVYTYDDCTRSQGLFIQVAAGLTAEVTTATEYEDCEGYTAPYGYRYPGTGEALDSGLIRLTFTGGLPTIDCPSTPGSEMQCQSATYSYYDGRRGGYYDLVYNWQRTTASSIPEVDVIVDVPAPGDSPTEDTSVPPS